MDNTFEEVCKKIRSFYLRKQVIFEQAIRKIRQIIEENDTLRDIYFPEKK